MIDFSKNDRMLINVFGEDIYIDNVKYKAIFDELTHSFDDVDTSSHTLTMMESDIANINPKRNTKLSIKGNVYLIQSIRPTNGVVTLVLNKA